MSKLEIKNLCLSYGSTEILHDVNISVKDGEFLVLVGPSGSGKSTILRTIAGLETLNSGEIILDETAINNFHPKDRDIAMVFQNYALYPHLTVYENLAFPLKMKKLEKKLIENSVNDVAELLGIKKYLLKRPKELSGGERQRVALGRAIVRKPKLFLMDEPLSNLDAKLRTQMRTELLKIKEKLSTTIIYVTHDQIEALTMGDRIVVLNHGKVQQIDTPANIYNNPTNTFVAGFIGNPPMNFLNINVINDSTVNFLNKEYKINSNFFGGKTGKHILGIRPEHISINDSNKADIEINLMVLLVEMLGSELIVHASLRNNLENETIIIKTRGVRNVVKGDEIKASFNFTNTKLFSLSGENLPMVVPA